MKNTFAILFMLASGVQVYAQYMTATRNSLYAGTDAALINPAFAADQPVFVSVNLFGGDFYANNNAVQSDKANYFNWINGDNLNLSENTSRIGKPYFYNETDLTSLSLNVAKGRVAYGFFTRARYYVDMRNAPAEVISEFVGDYSNQAVPSLVSIKNFETNLQVNSELGFSFAYMYDVHSNYSYTAGANLKFVQTLAHFNSRIKTLEGFGDEFNGYQVTDFQASYTSSYLATPYEGLKSLGGVGLAADIGVMYKQYIDNVDGYYPNDKRSNCAVKPYRFKLGASILDLGLLRQRKEIQRANVTLDDFSNAPNPIDSTGYIGTANPIDFLEGEGLLSTAPFWQMTPTTVSVQADYNFGRHLYAGAVLKMPVLPRGFKGIQPPSVLSINPRYERKNFSFMLPMSLFRFVQPQMGMVIRVRSFYIGTDKVIPFFIRSNIKGVSLFASLKVNLYRNPACPKLDTPQGPKKKQSVRHMGRGHKPSTQKKKEDCHTEEQEIKGDDQNFEKEEIKRDEPTNDLKKDKSDYEK